MEKKNKKTDDDREKLSENQSEKKKGIKMVQNKRERDIKMKRVRIQKRWKEEKKYDKERDDQ